jgi:hypothetical protein
MAIKFIIFCIFLMLAGCGIITSEDSTVSTCINVDLSGACRISGGITPGALEAVPTI